MMLALAPRPTAVYLCVGSTDMRKGFDGLMRVAAEQAARDVLQGGLFVFVNRRRDVQKHRAGVAQSIMHRGSSKPLDLLKMSCIPSH
jgi:hypothetical protein